jgi:hypothetical protein
MKTKAPNFRIMRRREARSATANITIPKIIKVARIDHGFPSGWGGKIPRTRVPRLLPARKRLLPHGADLPQFQPICSGLTSITPCHAPENEA